MSTRDHVRVWCDWPDWFRPRRCNWLNFSLVDLSCEWDRMFGTFEVTAGLLGFNVQFTCRVSRPNATGKSVQAMVRELIDESEATREA